MPDARHAAAGQAAAGQAGEPAANRVRAGFFSLSGRSPDGDDRPYLAWHQLDHMPEQYQLPGMVLGQRWASTPACRSSRAASEGDWDEVEHVVCYLMGDPLEQTVDDFLALGRHLAEIGRFPLHLPSHYRGGLPLLATCAAPRVLVRPEVVPFRPHRGAYLVVEEPTDPAAWEGYLHRSHADALPALVEVAGVAGAWAFATSPALRRPNFSAGDYRVTVLYLDGEPAGVGSRLEPVLRDAWAGEPTRPLLAAPFEAMMHWDWERFGP
jgi:hypothetical protein